VELLRLIFGLPVVTHWKVYLPVMGLTFVMIVPCIMAAEKRGKMKVGIASAIGLVLIGQLLLGGAPHMLWLQTQQTYRAAHASTNILISEPILIGTDMS